MTVWFVWSKVWFSPSRPWKFIVPEIRKLSYNNFKDGTDKGKTSGNYINHQIKQIWVPYKMRREIEKNISEYICNYPRMPNISACCPSTTYVQFLVTPERDSDVNGNFPIVLRKCIGKQYISSFNSWENLQELYSFLNLFLVEACK